MLKKELSKVITFCGVWVFRNAFFKDCITIAYSSIYCEDPANSKSTFRIHLEYIEK